MNFATINAVLPEEITDHIARVVHKRCFTPVADNITAQTINIMSDFDRAFEKSGRMVHIADFIRQEYGSKVNVIEDKTLDMTNVVFVFPASSRYALYHRFNNEQYLIDGSYTHDTIKVERYFRMDHMGRYHAECDRIVSYHPFHELPVSAPHVKFDLVDAGKKKWKHPLELFRAFRNRY